MCASPFQKRHKRRKAHDDHNVTSDTAIVAGTSFMCLCRTDKSVFHPFSFFGSIWHENAAGYRTRKRESAPATISSCCIFPVPKPSCPTFAGPGNSRQDHLKTNAAGRTPASASHARMTMTLAGLLSRRHESVAFLLSVAPPFGFSPWRIAPSRTLSLFLPASPTGMPMFPCRHSRRHQWSFSLQGQR